MKCAIIVLFFSFVQKCLQFDIPFKHVCLWSQCLIWLYIHRPWRFQYLVLIFSTICCNLMLRKTVEGIIRLDIMVLAQLEERKIVKLITFLVTSLREGLIQMVVQNFQRSIQWRWKMVNDIHVRLLLLRFLRCGTW